MFGSVPFCEALDVDENFSVYCRTDSTLVRWTGPNYDFSVVLYRGVPSGTTLHVDTLRDRIYFSSTSELLFLPIFGAIGSFANPTVVLPQSGIRKLVGNVERLFWLDSGVRASLGKEPATPMFDMGVPPGFTQYLVPDPNDPEYVWTAGPNTIYHAHYGGNVNGKTRPLPTKVGGLNGVTADSQFVYTSKSDGTIRRVSRAGL
jgi:hypothetical protein